MNSAPNQMPSAIAEAIGAVMAKVKNVEKQGLNTFHNYKFARIEDLIFQVQPAMVEAGLVITQDELHHQTMGDAVILATYAFSLSHKSGVTWGPVHQTGMASLRNTKGGYDDKALNKCHTAARKYFILGLFQVPAGDLPDADLEEDKPAPKSQAPTPPVGVKRLSSARAKEVGLHTEIKNKVEACVTEAMLDAFEERFDTITAQCPMSWLDSIHNMVLLRREELRTPQDYGEELDRDYAETMGGPDV